METVGETLIDCGHIPYKHVTLYYATIGESLRSIIMCGPVLAGHIFIAANKYMLVCPRGDCYRQVSLY